MYFLRIKRTFVIPIFIKFISSMSSFSSLSQSSVQIFFSSASFEQQLLKLLNFEYIHKFKMRKKQQVKIIVPDKNSKHAHKEFEILLKSSIEITANQCLPFMNVLIIFQKMQQRFIFDNQIANLFKFIEVLIDFRLKLTA